MNLIRLVVIWIVCIFSFLILLNEGVSIQQNRGCFYKTPSPSKARYVERKTNFLKEEFGIREEDIESTQFDIPVIFHVITKGKGLENGEVPISWILDQMDVLNGAYLPTGISFWLKRANYVFNPDWFNMTYGTDIDKEASKVLRQGGANTLNIFLAFLNDALGWSQFPWDYEDEASSDGLYIDYNTLPGGNLTKFNLGNTVVHESGHWFGLFHTFEGGCNITGDYTTDTPPEKEPASGCPIGRNSCFDELGPDRVDPIHNFMDYSDDACMSEFTPQQIYRMKRMFVIYRSGIFLNKSLPTN